MTVNRTMAAAALVAATGAGVATARAADHTRTFHVAHEYKAPRAATIWVPLPSDDAWQTIRDLHVDGAPWERVYDPRWGNLAARLHPSAAAIVIVRYEVVRKERVADSSRATSRPAPSGYAAWLAPDARVPLDARVRNIAAEVTAGKSTPMARARAAYDYVLTTMRYDKPAGTGQGWGQGDIEWACDKKYGNCTDFHALFIGRRVLLRPPRRRSRAALDRSRRGTARRARRVAELFRVPVRRSGRRQRSRSHAQDLVRAVT
ncbi:MAG: hypothetical protein LC659_00185 [Myxococcales bacterium]|nr:hypothetical protein [Myxococcales bacterium]